MIYTYSLITTLAGNSSGDQRKCMSLFVVNIMQVRSITRRPGLQPILGTSMFQFQC